MDWKFYLLILACILFLPAMSDSFGDAPTSQFALDLNNDNPTGITDNGSSFFVLQNNTTGLDMVYIYSMINSATSSFALDPNNDNPTGITTDGTSLYVLDADAKVYIYSVSGNFDNSFSINVLTFAISGITIDGNNMYVVDHSGTLYIYDITDTSNPNSINTISLDSNIDGPNGITTNGIDLFIVNDPDNTIHVADTNTGINLGDNFGARTLYTISLDSIGSLTGITTNGTNLHVVSADDGMVYTFAIPAPSPGVTLDVGNDLPTGITIYGDKFYVVDYFGDLFIYTIDESNTVPVDLFSTTHLGANLNPSGITTINGTTFYIVDYSGKLYAYSDDTLSQIIDLGSEIALNGITTDGTSLYIG